MAKESKKAGTETKEGPDAANAAKRQCKNMLLNKKREKYCKQGMMLE